MSLARIREATSNKYHQRDTLLKTITSPSSKSGDIAFDLETECHIEILRDMRLGPELKLVILNESNFLNSRPS